MTKVGLDIVGLDRVQGLGDALQLHAPALRLYERFDLVVEGHQSNAIAMSLRDPGEHQSGVDGMVELLQVAGGRGHQPSAFDGDHDLLATLGLDLDHNGPVATCSCSPADPPDVVAANIVPQPCERGRRSRWTGPPQSGRRAKSAPQAELDAFVGDDVRKDSDLAWMGQPDLPKPPTRVAPHLQVHRSEAICPALG